MKAKSRMRPQSLIKEIDAFKSPLFLFLHRRDKETNLKKHDWRMGSAIGGLNTVIMIFFSVIAVYSSMIDMLNGSKDIIRKTHFSNSF
jgi:hypothetical protein